MVSKSVCSGNTAQQKSAGKGLSRRGFITALAGTTLAAVAFPNIAKASVSTSRELSFHNTHTGEKLVISYYERGEYLSDALQGVNYLLRDHRTGDVHAIDTALLDQLYDLRMMFGTHKPFHIISGYRSPYTNALLNKKSSGVAKKSLHMQGCAIDIRIPGIDSKKLRNAAIAMRSGGVGYYQRSDFIHLDTGRVRSW